MQRQIIHTPLAPKAIGTYSQAVRVGDTVYISGQIPLDPASGQLVSGDIEAEIRRVFDNISAIAQAAGGSLASAVKLSVFLTDLAISPRSTRSWRPISASPIRRAPRSASPLCRAVRGLKWSAYSASPETRAAAAASGDRRAGAEAGAPGRRASGRHPVRAAAALRGPHARGTDRRAAARHACRGGRRGAAGRDRVPPPAYAAGAPGRWLRVAHPAIFLFFQCPARRPGARYPAALPRRAATRSAGTGDRAPRIPPHRRPGRAAAADHDADLSGHRRPDAGPLRARWIARCVAWTRAVSPSCCRRVCSGAPACRRCARRWSSCIARRSEPSWLNWPPDATRRSAAWHSRNCWRISYR
jgi:enamine deaminase RidA (YjgF/YER057c/UK114 family)